MRFSFPAQELEIRRGDELKLKDGATWSEVVAVDRAGCTIDVKIGPSKRSLRPRSAFKHKWDRARVRRPPEAPRLSSSSSTSRIVSIHEEGSAACSGLSSTVTGNRTVNRAPPPDRLATLTSPPMSWQCRQTRANPRPVPPYLRAIDVSACTKGWKSFSLCSSVKPMPVSVTMNSKHC